MKSRCKWVGDDRQYIKYHDEEWGVPLRDDQKLFEFLTLETFQAGLNWLLVLKKRENFCLAFDQFDYMKIARYDEKKINELISDQGIIRNRMKIKAAVNNAACFIKVQEEFGSFSHYTWGFVRGKPVQNAWSNDSDIPASTALSDRISADLKRRGFKFVGSRVVYAHMQATGMVNDHTIDCFRHREVQNIAAEFKD